MHSEAIAPEFTYFDPTSDDIPESLLVYSMKNRKPITTKWNTVKRIVDTSADIVKKLLIDVGTLSVLSFTQYIEMVRLLLRQLSASHYQSLEKTKLYYNVIDPGHINRITLYYLHPITNTADRRSSYVSLTNDKVPIIEVKPLMITLGSNDHETQVKIITANPFYALLKQNLQKIAGIFYSNLSSDFINVLERLSKIKENEWKKIKETVKNSATALINQKDERVPSQTTGEQLSDISKFEDKIECQFIFEHNHSLHCLQGFIHSIVRNTQSSVEQYSLQICGEDNVTINIM